MLLDSKAIGIRIKTIRKGENISQEQFAELIDTSTRTISNIETGAVIPGIQTLANIAEKCNSSIDLIIGIRG